MTHAHRHAPPVLAGDGVENPCNLDALADIASAFATRWVPVASNTTAGYQPVIAFDNAPGARELFGASIPRVAGRDALVIVGNERRGISPAVRDAATHRLFLPMPGRVGIDSLNVAAAAAVGMFYLSRERVPAMPATRHPDRRRPPVLLLAPTDHAETGSAIRSAAALGWLRLLVDDRHGVWFDTPRAERTEGRAAARWHRNRIRVTRCDHEAPAMPRVVIVTADRGTPIERTPLADADQLLVIADDPGEAEAAADTFPDSDVTVARVDHPGEARLRYRALATIALAEAARQIGRPPQRGPRRDSRNDRGPTRQKWRYRCGTTRGAAIAVAPATEVLTRADLLGY